MKTARKRWSLVSAVVAFGLIATFVPWQAFAQEGSVTTEEATTEISVVEQDAEKASETLPVIEGVTGTEDESVLDENTDDVADETTGTSTEASTLDESDTSLQEAEDTPPVLQTDELVTQDTTTPPEEEAISPLAVYSGTCGANLSWTLDTDTGVLAIAGTGAMADYANFTVVPWHAYQASITSVELPYGLTSIGECAFSQCGYITSITIPSSVTSIGDNAFLNCMQLSSCTIPDSVTSIGNGAFAYTNITSITFPSSVVSIEDYVCGDCFSLTEVIFKGSVAPTLSEGTFGYWENASGTIYCPAGATGYTESWKNALIGLASWPLVQPVLQADTNDLVFADLIVGSSSSTQSITITGADLTEDISCALSGSGASFFTLDTATLSSTGGTLSVSFDPAAVGSHVATLTLSSDSIPGSATTVITLSGTVSAAPVADTPATDPPAQGSSALPQTGDATNSNSLLFLVAFVTSGSALVLLALRARKKRKAA